jgi:hypothetical protein
VPDPFAVLGLPPTAGLAEVRAARRRLAKDLHPDRGGDSERMQEVNEAFDRAVRTLLGRTDRPVRAPGPPPPPPPPPAPRRTATGVQHDDPSFTIAALPAEAFEALALAGREIGTVLVDDPPYLLEVVLTEPAPCWCRIELLPEAGATTVMLTVASLAGRPAPAVEDVRDVWVTMLNQLGDRWPAS